MWQFWTLTFLGDIGPGCGGEEYEDAMVLVLETISTEQVHEIDRARSFLEEIMFWVYCAGHVGKGERFLLTPECKFFTTL